MLGNPTWIWARWPFHGQEPLYYKVWFTAYLAVSGLLCYIYIRLTLTTKIYKKINIQT